jgi:hypothetical protein
MTYGEDVHDFLRVLDAVVARDRGPSGLSGTLTLSVESAGPWWTARFERGWTKTEIGPRPPDPTASIVLGAADAEAILATGRLSSRPDLRVDGEVDLVERFAKRFFVRKGMVALRVEAGERVKGGRR